MSCEQKSGVFLKVGCKRTVTNTCTNCEKKICHVHFHHFEANDLCEDCYWEKYLYAEEKKQKNENDDVYDDFDTTIVSTSYSTSDTEDSGFKDGFGGGGFGGGGASGEWTEGEALGFNETDSSGGLLDNDDTFYYS
ncbi:MAG: hypothetical protein AB8B59_15450 [Maribacter sp.]